MWRPPPTNRLLRLIKLIHTASWRLTILYTGVDEFCQARWHALHIVTRVAILRQEKWQLQIEGFVENNLSAVSQELSIDSIGSFIDELVDGIGRQRRLAGRWNVARQQRAQLERIQAVTRRRQRHQFVRRLGRFQHQSHLRHTTRILSNDSPVSHEFTYHAILSMRASIMPCCRGRIAFPSWRPNLKPRPRKKPHKKLCTFDNAGTMQVWQQMSRRRRAHGYVNITLLRLLCALFLDRPKVQNHKVNSRTFYDSNNTDSSKKVSFGGCEEKTTSFTTGYSSCSLQWGWYLQ